MKLYKRNGIYWYRFQNKKRLFRGTTELTNLKDATTAANKIRNSVILGDLGILERGPAPTLAEFIEKDFLPYVRDRHKEKQNTLDYYLYGSGQLSAAKIAKVRLSEVTDQHVAEYIRDHSSFSASGINQGLRTLRRILHLAYEWHRIDRRPVIRLAPGENMRTRVLTQEEETLYLAKCTEPWRTMAILMLELGLRPGEIFALRVEDVDFQAPVLEITGGKSKAAQRKLPLTDLAYTAIESWWLSQGAPTEGWMFPSPGRPEHHYAQQRAFHWHHKALADSHVTPFQPYCLRHTALTRTAKHCRSSFTVAAIAGHSDIRITQRYVHPQADEIQKAFEEKSGHKIGHAAALQRLKLVTGNDDGER